MPLVPKAGVAPADTVDVKRVAKMARAVASFIFDSESSLLWVWSLNENVEIGGKAFWLGSRR